MTNHFKIVYCILSITILSFVYQTNRIIAFDINKKLTQYMHEIINTENGLPQNTVQCILQTKDGYMWLGTQEGLIRYDGNTFRLYDKKNTTELEHNNIWCLYEDKNGILWIGTSGGGISTYKDGKFTNYSTKNGLSHNIVLAFCEDNEDNIWIGTRGGGISVFRDGKFIKYSAENGLTRDVVLALYKDVKGNIWIGTDGGGISIFKDGMFTNFNTKNGLSQDNILTFNEDKQGNMWIGTLGGGINVYKEGKFTNYSTKDGLNNDNVRAISEDRNGNIWIGTLGGGISIFKNGKFNNYSTKNGLSNNMVLSLYEDQEGNIWIGTLGGGINLYKEGKFTNYSAKDGLNNEIVLTLFEDKENNMWIGTDGGGLNIYKDGKYQNYSSKNGLSKDVVLTLYEDRESKMWIGTDGGGLDIYKDDKFSNYSVTNGLTNNTIFSLFEDREGSMWIGNDGGGIDVYKNGRFINYSTKNGLCNDVVLSLYEDKSGNMWIGTRGGGISIYKDGKFLNYSTKEGLCNDIVFSFYEDRSGNMWIGTRGGGISIYKNGKFSNYSSKQGLFDDTIFWMQEDNSDNIWMTCNKGIFRINTSDILKYDNKLIDNIPYVSYGLKDGLLTQECNGGSTPAGWMSIDNRVTYENESNNKGVRNYSGKVGYIKTLFFPTIKGYTSIDPNNIRYNTVKPNVHIEEIKINGEAIEKQHNKDTSYELNHDKNNLYFRFTACSYTYPKALKFKYMLVGYDDNWKEAPYDLRFKEYMNLPSGDYKFRVIACNNDGIWNEEGASFTFVILPAFTETIWFYSFCGLGIFLFAFTIYQIRVARLKARERELQRRVDEQTIEITEKAKTIEIEKEKSDKLLLNILPEEVANELKENNFTVPKKYELVSVLFTDLVGFTKIAETFTPEELIDELGKVFEYFDNVVMRNKCEKIKTIGDGYLCAAGIPKANLTNPVDIVLTALEIAKFMNMAKNIKQELSLPYWELRIGIHTGPVMAGVVGKSKFSYDIWGDTVNTASRMESSGIPGKINISETTYNYVKDLFLCEYRGKIAAKNKGEIDMFIVNGIQPELSINGECQVPNEKFKEFYEKIIQI